MTARREALAPTQPVERLVWTLRRAIFGRLLASAEEIDERLSKVKALATFSSDNLSSVAYATEAIMFTLLAAGSASFWLVNGPARTRNKPSRVYTCNCPASHARSLRKREA